MQKDLEVLLSELYERDASFDSELFLNGAVEAYERVVTAFAQADFRTLASHTSTDVLSHFEADIARRDGHSILSLIKVETSTITNVVLDGPVASLTVRFVSRFLAHTAKCADDSDAWQETNYLNLVDEWTFARTIKSKDPNWTLIATQPG